MNFEIAFYFLFK